MSLSNSISQDWSQLRTFTIGNAWITTWSIHFVLSITEWWNWNYEGIARRSGFGGIVWKWWWITIEFYFGKEQARQVLNSLAFQPFENCQSLNRTFANIPSRPGLYAIRHRSIGLLYIGKSKSLRGRFSGGHKAFLWSWLKIGRASCRERVLNLV